ncbi:hypothetical protein HBH56_036740 [Parastagonospora nodorum]|uniref:Uncharacterized protein n=1 Tax=Phaeosphaeria nodorum (strain SN15 / ATCC MYA-4574 / FGSC 10173) TaxID=321614 RepID=A0A7U2I327_PHANO|nr:hypothetical protein HBH56_036740 [Parastagonospora nodorum]QRD00005.1 hypothetical protein JI435_414370 [Parastagonospora nodorum SN15]KAH3933488.1 hypothetical protein HBH54_062730 [Parastagonospora nodorum]KAH3979743.1 hypothetical protein HBH51_058390 [Parastagonospora nodorum]KAH3980476.1 hypothetical protein HBH52_094540 [Parastagonospora nodorum]
MSSFLRHQNLTLAYLGTQMLGNVRRKPPGYTMPHLSYYDAHSYNDFDPNQSVVQYDTRFYSSP